MSDRIRIMICNNPAGTEIVAAEITGTDIESITVDDKDDPCGIRYEVKDRQLNLPDQNKSFSIFGHTRWVGNIYWDAITMDRSAAREFGDLLLANGFSIMGDTEGSMWWNEQSETESA